jgi:hypothetical protein
LTFFSPLCDVKAHPVLPQQQYEWADCGFLGTKPSTTLTKLEMDGQRRKKNLQIDVFHAVGEALVFE